MKTKDVVGYRLFEDLIGCLQCSQSLIDIKSPSEVENEVYKGEASNLTCSQCGKDIK